MLSVSACPQENCWSLLSAALRNTDTVWEARDRPQQWVWSPDCGHPPSPDTQPFTRPGAGPHGGRKVWRHGWGHPGRWQHLQDWAAIGKGRKGVSVPLFGCESRQAPGQASSLERGQPSSGCSPSTDFYPRFYGHSTDSVFHKPIFGCINYISLL